MICLFFKVDFGLQGIASVSAQFLMRVLHCVISWWKNRMEISLCERDETQEAASLYNLLL